MFPWLVTLYIHLLFVRKTTLCVPSGNFLIIYSVRC